MAYNNFPVAYQPAQIYYPQMPAQSNAYSMNQGVSTPQPTQNNSIIWVQGEAGAKSYLVAPNTTVQLWDSEEQVIYLKSADASGMPSMRVLDYTVREPNLPSNNIVIDEDKYISKNEYSTLERKIDALQEDIDRIKDFNAKKKEKN